MYLYNHYINTIKNTLCFYNKIYIYIKPLYKIITKENINTNTNI